MTSSNCTVCHFALNDSVELRDHYRTEWHSYNLKRKLIGKGPIDEKSFHRKLELLESTKTTIEKGNSHLKHRDDKRIEDFEKRTGSDINIFIRNQPLPYRITYCYFDNTVHDNLEKCFIYMRNKYSFVIPNLEYLSDPEGLALYLGEKVFEGHMCLFCDKTFSTLSAVRDHMISLGHTMLGDHLEEQKEDIGRFFDFSGSYKELHIKPSKIKTIEDDTDEWEDIENSDDILVDDILSTYNLKSAEITEFGDLRLPNGKEVVHRNLAYVYKQRLFNYDDSRIKQLKIAHNEVYKCMQTSRFDQTKYRLPKSAIIETTQYEKYIQSKLLKSGINNNKLQKYFVRRDIVW
ncbi:zinc C2H2 type domain-containing protein [Cryptosporidium andersoni]|uniref:Zinc C2H2 type domain-containing protein n=1 Tax=Cryptosporidium andersoni TaxID=117008 RepID=A0A1J4MTW2_9CRYT|nr:zinc C2H2 type domain-containing protein [Cryptosporidium andersoni]